MTEYHGLPLLEFESRTHLRQWLMTNHATSPGIWMRMFKVRSAVPSITFEDLLDQGLCFGWSESLRHGGDQQSYLQRFTPRKARGTTSPRNLDRARALIASGEMTDAGRYALRLD